MELIARLGERVERVSIERRGEQYRIRVGEREHQVEARSLGPFVQSLIVDGESHETAVFRTGGGWSVSWRGRTTAVELVDPLTHLAEQAHGAAVHSGRQVVAAYMPGRVVAVAVAAGQTIEAGAALVVLEAMKMQNEIQAERAGTVVHVHVAAGQAVELGDPLVEIE
jgi:3-methylcrotonyl-CoA carboxylase alpha subunit